MSDADLHDATCSVFVHLASPGAASALTLDQQLLVAEAFENYQVAVDGGGETSARPLLNLEPFPGAADALAQLERQLAQLQTGIDNLTETLHLTRALDLIREARSA